MRKIFFAQNIQVLAYNDWYSPSKDELSLIYTNLYLTGHSDLNHSYWSSSEADLDRAWKLNFSTNTWSQEIKTISSYVRGVRSFVGSSGAYSLGNTGPGGGLIFYVSGVNYMECTSVNISSGKSWSNVLGSAIGTTGTAVGTGQANTTSIINQAGHTDSAAKLCDDLVTYN